MSSGITTGITTGSAMKKPDLTAVLAALAIACSLAACEATGTPVEAGMAPHQEGPVAWDADFRDGLLADAVEADSLSAKTRSGHNLSEMTVGWFVHGVLSTLSSVDDGLEAHFGGNIMAFLRSRMSAQPETEVQAVAAMAESGGQTAPLRRAAEWALESLRHIPDKHDPPERQAQDRADLASALDRLSTILKDTATPHLR